MVICIVKLYPSDLLCEFYDDDDDDFFFINFVCSASHLNLVLFIRFYRDTIQKK